MDYKKLLDHSDDWLKYAILLHLFHETKETLGEIRKTALMQFYSIETNTAFISL